MRLAVLTWNVLHRVHAVNWKETAAEVHADEPARIAGITRRIQEAFASGLDVACLQEVSGDQLASVRAMATELHVLTHTYPRVPKLRTGGPPGLADPREHLVILVRGHAARAVAAVTSTHDPGKGYLVVDVGGVLVVDTHVSFGKRGREQVEDIAAAVAKAPRVIVVGDFNAPLPIVKACLEESLPFEAADLGGQRPTRRPSPGKDDGRIIDHLFVAGGRCTGATVHDGGGISDHEPVTADFAFD